MLTPSMIEPFHTECLAVDARACDTCRAEAGKCRLGGETVSDYLRCVARSVQMLRAMPRRGHTPE